ncbi:MAG: hypothetical protein EA342_20665 [Leptolyngbya sp. LCM1.Bin17]|nr:MAG: hypothetical protein EA342_20665 [Leptolyngbya sp. LCM1.Bin17]
MEDRSTSQGKMEAQLQEWGAKLDEMQAKANQVSADKKADLDQQIAALRAKRNAMQQRLSDLTAASDDAWQSVKVGLQEAWHDLRQGFEEAASKFK